MPIVLKNVNDAEAVGYPVAQALRPGGWKGPAAADRKTGFTVLELVTVLAIMIILMGMGITSIVGLRQGAEMRSAVSALRTTMTGARQYAVTKRQRTYVSFLNESTYVISNKLGLISETNYLPRGVVFDSIDGLPITTPSSPIVFSPSGGSGSAMNHTVVVKEVAGTVSSTITVLGLTGLTKVTTTP